MKNEKLIDIINRQKKGSTVVLSIATNLKMNLTRIGKYTEFRQLVIDVLHDCEIIEYNNLKEFIEIDYLDLHGKVDSEILKRRECIAIVFDFGNNESGAYLVAVENGQYVIIQLLYDTIIGVEKGFLNGNNEIGIFTNECFSESPIYELGDYISFYNRYLEYNSFLNKK